MNSLSHINKEDKIAYLKRGENDSQAILLLHGNSSSSNFFQPQFTSSNLKNYQLIAPDLIGHGKSERTDNLSLYSLKNIALRIKDFIQSLKTKQLIIYGCSLGGHLAIELIPLLGETLKGVVISGAPPLKNPLNWEESFFPNPALGIFPKKDLSEEELQLWCQESLSNQQVADVIMEDFRTTDPSFRPYLAQSLTDITSFSNQKELIEGYLGQVAIINGAEEKFVPLQYLKSLEIGHLFRNEILTIPNSAHYPSLENPTYFNELLKDFADKTFNK